MVTMNKNSINELAKEVLDIEANSILRLKNNIGDEFDKAVDYLYNCSGRVIVTGMGKSGLIGRKIAATLTSTGTPAYFLHPAESTHGDSGIITRNDVVIAISNSGETQELLNLLPLIKRFGVTMIGMTGNLNSTLSHSSDVTLDISVGNAILLINITKFIYMIIFSFILIGISRVLKNTYYVFLVGVGLVLFTYILSEFVPKAVRFFLPGAGLTGIKLFI